MDKEKIVKKKRLISKANEQYLDSISEEGILTLGSLLKRVSDLLISQVQDLYSNQGIKFKPTWFPILLSIKKIGTTDLKTLSSKRRITQSAISQILKDLEANSLVSYVSDANDLRQKKVSITDKGLEIINQLIPSIRLVEEALKDILLSEEYTLLEILRRFEKELSEKPISARKLSKLESVSIVPLDETKTKEFNKLVRDFIENYFEIEKEDEKVLEDPLGGNVEQVFLAIHEEKVIGTVSVYRKSEKRAELAKLIVEDQYHGRGVGTDLLKTAIDYVLENGFQEIFLETNSKLVPANNLYEKFDFSVVELGSTNYKRVDTHMLKNLN